MTINYVHTVRVDPRTEFARKDISHRLAKKTLLRGKKIWVQNQDQKGYFSYKDQKKVFVLPNPVANEFLTFERNYETKDKYVITAAGRLKAQKNFEMLISVCAELSKKYDDIILNIYGEGDSYNKLSELIEALGVADRIKLMGRSNNLLPVYTESDLFVLSSNYEGMPNVLLEAMACGTPCVSTDCPTGPSEMIENEKNGLLVSVNDYEQMTRAIEFMYNNRERSFEMGRAAKQFVKENFSVSQISAEFEKALKQ